MIGRIISADKLFRIRDTRYPGLVLTVGKSGTKTWFLDYRDARGKRQSFRIGSTKIFSPKDVRREASKINLATDPAKQKRDALNEQQQAQVRTLSAFLNGEYRSKVLNHRKSGEATYRRITAVFADFLNVDMRKLSVKEIMNQQHQRLDAGVLPQTLNRDRVAMIALINEALQQGVIDHNPLSRWRRWKVESDQRVRFLGPGERQRFMASLKMQPDWFRVIVLLALNTGFRRGELLSLTWGRVDLKRGQLTVAASSSKTSKTRHVALNSAAMESLKAWRSNVISLDPDALVFPSRAGRQFVNIARRWRIFCCDANVKGFRFHDCRHDFASRLVQAGVDLYQVKELLGHASIQQTERYAHLAPDFQRSAVEKLT